MDDDAAVPHDLDEGMEDHDKELELGGGEDDFKFPDDDDSHDPEDRYH
jgi:hypothetical protein